MKKLFLKVLPFIVLIGLIFICFHRTLASYFVADDFGQIAYAAGICKGNWGALLSNFTGNYMQIPVMKIYRPCLLLSFVADYFIWHTQSIGYFLSNIIWLAASSVMLFLLLRELTKGWDNKRSILFSLLSASLFAANPLHCESISFVSGRDNVISAFFYLLTLWCFVRKGAANNKKLLVLGIVLFWPALLSKELAIGLAPVLTGIIFFFPELFSIRSNDLSFTAKIKLSIEKSLPLWINTAIYFLIRFLALGTFTGGYTGDVGAGLNSNSLARWESIDTILRIVYPLNAAIFGVLHDYYAIALTILYAILLTLVIIKNWSYKWSPNILGLLLLWILTTVVPIYQLWGLGENLEGARFFFFLSIPLSILLPILVFRPTDKAEASIEINNIESLGIIVFTILVLLDINITYNNNVAWVHAGKQSKACLIQSQRLAKSIPPNRKTAIIGLPKDQDGAHIIYNASTFNTMMSPPFSAENYNDKFITFDPLFYGNPWAINPSRLRTVLSETHTAGLFAWNTKTLSFDQMPTPSPQVLTRNKMVSPIVFQHLSTPAAMVTSNLGVLYHIVHQICLKDQGLFIAPTNFDPYQYDFLELTLKTTLPQEMMFVYWKGNAVNSLEYCEPQHPLQIFICGATSDTKLRIHLSDYWHWYTQGNISRLQLEFVPGQSIEIKDMRLICDKDIAPTISIPNVLANNTGVYALDKEHLQLTFDGSSVKDCTAIKVEISKPNYFFDESQSTNNKTAIMKTIIQSTNKGNMLITNKLFVLSGHYQIRARCLDKTGNLIGENSDSITINVANI